MNLYLIFLSILLGGLNIPLRAETQPLTFRGNMSWYSMIAVQNLVKDSPANPDNTYLGLETKSAYMDFRPSLKIDGGTFQLVARPQLKTGVARKTAGGKEPDEHPKSSTTWLEAYGVYTAGDEVQVSYGVQNYQWGAAETLNPSNRIFHDDLDTKGILATTQGRTIARANLTWTKEFSTVLMSETERNKDVPEFRAEETFETKALMKHEYSWNSGADYLGVVFGSGETGSPWVGEYFNLTLLDGLTIYADASHQKGSNSWYPVQSFNTFNQEQIMMEQSKLKDGKIYHLVVGGLRYSFEGGSDLRFEYLANTVGWTNDQNKLAMNALDTRRPQQLPDLQKNLKRILKPGLEYRGQRYAMLSLRMPDSFQIKDFTLYARCMRSLTDQSLSAYGSAEYEFRESSHLILSIFGTQGALESDLRGVVASNISAGLRQDF